MKQKTIGYVCYENGRSGRLEELSTQWKMTDPFASGYTFTSGGIKDAVPEGKRRLEADLAREWDLCLTVDYFLRNSVAGLTNRREDTYSILEFLEQNSGDGVKEALDSRELGFLGRHELDDAYFPASKLFTEVTGRFVDQVFSPVFYNKGKLIDAGGAEADTAEAQDLDTIVRRIPFALNHYFHRRG